MGDLISREQAIAKIEDLNAISFYELNEHSKEAYSEIMAAIKNMPSAEAEWIESIVSDLISREQAIEKVKAVADKWLSDLSYGSHKQGFIWGTDTAIQTICDIPSAEKTGKWIEQDDEYNDAIYQCSVCGEEFVTIEGTPADNLWNYCPNCGARMVNDESAD